MRYWLRRAFYQIVDFVFPPLCFSCREELMPYAGRMEEGGFFCARCFDSLHYITPPFCHHCGLPFSSGEMEGAVCAICREEPPFWRQARAVLVYDSVARNMILSLKYSDRIVNHLPLANLMGKAGRTLLEEADYLIPVPLHRKKLRQRRYNQAALLARALGKEYNIPVLLHALQRVRLTRPLASLSVAERWAELQNVMQIHPDYKNLLAERSVLLIDDIMTSGATAGLCTQALCEAGCARVDVLVAARACRDERSSW